MSSAGVAKAQAQDNGQRPSAYMKDITDLDIHPDVPRWARDILMENYWIDDKMIEFARMQWAWKANRLIIPIRRPGVGLPIGFVARSLTGSLPKAKTYIHTVDQPIGCFYMFGGVNFRPTWVVEDQLSALRASAFVDSLALLSTNFSESLIADVRRSGTRNLVICLDRDAKDKAVMYARRYSGLMNHIQVRIPPKDLKDMSPDELKAFINRDEDK